MANASTRAVVVALEHIDYYGAPCAPGQVVLVRPAEAAAMVYRLQARWPHPDEALGPWTAPAQAPIKRRSYKRRDLVAE